MRSILTLTIDGVAVTVTPGTTVAAALQRSRPEPSSGRTAPASTPPADVLRRSLAGEPRGPLCGMGICFECRATIDGRSHQRACRVLCREGMRVETEMRHA